MQQKIALELQCCLYWSCNSSTVTVVYSTIRTPIQNTLTCCIMWVGKPRKYKLLILPKLGKLGGCVVLIINPPVFSPYNLSLYRERHQNLVFTHPRITYLTILKFQEQGMLLRMPFLLTSG